VLLGDGFDLADEADDGLIFLIRLAQGGFELLVGIQEPLDLLHRVDDEHVHQILARSVQPVVEWLFQIIQIYQ